MPSQHRSHPDAGAGKSRYPGSFKLAIREAIEKLGWRVGRWLGDSVECKDAQDRDQVIGLENLFRRAKRIERSDWPALISEFLESSQHGPIDNPPQDLKDVSDQLLVRLGPPMAMRGQAPEVWQQALDETGLVLSLVVDFPKSMFYVTAEMVEKSGETGVVWLEKALANLRERTQDEMLKRVHDESGLRQCCVGDAYDASRALLLDLLVPEAEHLGLFVAVPSRDELLVLPVSKQALAFVPMLKMAAAGNHRKAPYPISDEVYWLRGGQWKLFAVRLQDNQAHVNPPEEFLAVLKELMPEGEEPTAD